jgi:hypothetical protein
VSLQHDACRRAHAAGYRALPDGEIVDGNGTPVALRLRRDAQRGEIRPYYYFSVPRAGSKSGKIEVHKYVAFCAFGDAAFAPGVEARHLDGDSTNNAGDNIALGTKSDNEMDKPEATRRRVALLAASKRRSLTDARVRRLVALSRKGWTGKRLAAHFKIAKSQVSEILSGKLYSSLTGITQQPRLRADAARLDGRAVA